MDRLDKTPRTTAETITAVSAVSAVGIPAATAGRGVYIYIINIPLSAVAVAGRLLPQNQLLRLIKSREECKMKNWLSNQVQNQPPSQTGSALLTQFKADVDQLISHPSQANWPADQRVTHATQLLEIASDEGFTDQIPDYQLDWINQRSKAYV